MSQTRSYIEARYDCGLKGGYVTSVKSSAEQDFIDSLKPYSYQELWIGLEKNPLTNVYEWNDGSPLNFEAFSWSWSNSNNTCVFMKYKEWYKDECLGARRSYICVRPGSKQICKM